MNNYVIIDTNVLISALLSPYGNPATILKLVTSQTLHPIVETRIYQEYQNVLSRPRFKFSAEDIQAVLILFKNEGLWIVPPPILDDVPDPSDLPFIELAYHTRAPVITGDAKHFPDDILVLNRENYLKG